MCVCVCAHTGGRGTGRGCEDPATEKLESLMLKSGVRRQPLCENDFMPRLLPALPSASSPLLPRSTLLSRRRGGQLGPLLPGSMLSGCSRACAGLRRPQLRGHLVSGVRPGERTGLGESVLAWEFSGSSHHSARPHASADYPRTWSSGSESRRNNPPRSTQTCWGKSRRSQIAALL